MPQHFTKNTVSAAFYCNKCGKPTQHRIDDGRKGPCLSCLDKRQEQHDSTIPEVPEPKQEKLF